MKVGIIGVGWVGSSVAISTLQSGVATELLLYDVRGEIAEGEAMDLSHGASFYPAARVRCAPIEEMLDADAVVIAAGRGGKPGESRLDLLRDNASIVSAIARKLAAFRGVVVVVTNPVDVLTRIVTEVSGLPPSRVIGTGTMLDTARLRQLIGQALRIEPRSVHAYVIGEHGDSEVVLWSQARAGGNPLRGFEGWNSATEGQLAERVRLAAYEIIRRKGATNHAIGLVTAALLKWMLRGERRILTVSRLQDSAPELEQVALSLPCIVDRGGAVEVLMPDMSAQESDALVQSARLLRKAAASIGAS
jgi:L-lactate dehydrogenase